MYSIFNAKSVVLIKLSRNCGSWAEAGSIPSSFKLQNVQVMHNWVAIAMTSHSSSILLPQSGHFATLWNRSFSCASSTISLVAGGFPSFQSIISAPEDDSSELLLPSLGDEKDESSLDSSNKRFFWRQVALPPSSCSCCWRCAGACKTRPAFFGAT